jgi:hypothetical protein
MLCKLGNLKRLCRLLCGKPLAFQEVGILLYSRWVRRLSLRTQRSTGWGWLVDPEGQSPSASGEAAGRGQMIAN